MPIFSVKLYDDAGQKCKLRFISADKLTEAAEHATESGWAVWSVSTLTAAEHRHQLLLNQIAKYVQPSLAIIAAIAFGAGLWFLVWKDVEELGEGLGAYSIAVMAGCLVVFAALRLVFVRGREPRSIWKSADVTGQEDVRSCGVNMESVPSTAGIRTATILLAWPAVLGVIPAVVFVETSDRPLTTMNWLLILGFLFQISLLGYRNKCIGGSAALGR